VVWLLYVVLAIVLSLLAAAVGLYALSRRLAQREPYGSFIRLGTRSKVKFFHRLITDPRVPRLVKVLPFLLAGYLAFPIDLIPDFIPVLGYVDDVAIAVGVLALVIRLTPREAIDDIIRELAQSESN
jgi:uncharacterized membrane protein YkvA (DUF1232 family)